MCQYLIEEQKVNVNCINENNEKPIDLSTNKETANYLSKYMTKTDPKDIKKKKNKKDITDDGEDIFSSMG